MSNFYLFDLLLLFGTVRGDIRFKAVRNGTAGPVLCAAHTFAITQSVRSQIECSQRCSLDDGCMSFNFKKNSDKQPQQLCERFNYLPRNLVAEDNCAHFQVRGTLQKIQANL